LLFNSHGDQAFFNPAEITLAKLELFPQPVIKGLELIQEWAAFDLALLKADFKNVRGDYFKQKKQFDFLEVDFNIVAEGVDVYSFGYPLPDFDIVGKNVIIGVQEYRPRITSAIISSHYETAGFAWGGGFPKHYVIDKALNLGNSGGPIILRENGKAFSVCTHFDPVNIVQPDSNRVIIPSLYGITSSLKNIEATLSNVL
jgi:serine protease Do